MTIHNLSALTKEIDNDGIPVINETLVRDERLVHTPKEVEYRRSWTTQRRWLQAVIEQLRETERLISFLEVRQLRLQTSVCRQVITTTEIDTVSAVAKLEAELSSRRAALANLKTISRSIVGYHLMNAPGINSLKDQCIPAESPVILLRFWTDKSHSPYDPELGFRCSGWRECRPATSFSEIREMKGPLTLESLRSHCEGHSRPSQWISFSDDASWILERVNESWRGNVRVALVCVARLNILRIPWQRSDELVREEGGHCYSKLHRGGINFAWSNHYLVYGWVPAECILATFDFEAFRQACLRSGISVHGSDQSSHKLLRCLQEDSVVDDLTNVLQNTHV